MAEIRTIVNVRDLTAEGHAKANQPVWLVEMSLDGSSTPTHAHHFPHETLDWRAAEYGIPPADVDTLIDVVLHEPHVDLQHTDEAFVYNTGEATARAAHLARVAASPVRVHDPAGHLDKIRQAHRSLFDPAAHAERRQQVAQIRAGSGTAPHIKLVSGR